MTLYSRYLPVSCLFHNLRLPLQRMNDISVSVSVILQSPSNQTTHQKTHVHRDAGRGVDESDIKREVGKEEEDND